MKKYILSKDDKELIFIREGELKYIGYDLTYCGDEIIVESIYKRIPLRKD